MIPDMEIHKFKEKFYVYYQFGKKDKFFQNMYYQTFIL